MTDLTTIRRISPIVVFKKSFLALETVTAIGITMIVVCIMLCVHHPAHLVPIKMNIF
ncbi:MAG: hypothetical protein QW547_03820 [Candidatus Bathyarchaeia archaeon]